MSLTAVSLFAGIGGFDEALRRAGVHVTAAVEIDPAARGVLADRFPETPLFNDVCEVTADDIRATGFVPGRGILTAGWPCQDLSLAGRRLGLGGARSGLFWEVVRLIADLRPRWFCLENVPGLLSAVCPCLGGGACGGGCTEPHPVRGGACGGGQCMELHGGAMGAVVGALAGLGYGLGWRVLDAQYFGVPQRRRRVVFVGCDGDGAAPVEVLLEPEGGGGDSAPRRPARAGSAAVSALSASGGGADDNDATGGRLIAAPLQAAGTNGRGHRVDAEGAAGGHLLVAPTLMRHHGRNKPDQETLLPVAYALRADPGGVGQAHNTTLPVVTHALTAEGHDASEDGSGRGAPLVPIAFDWKTDGSDRTRPNISEARTSTLGTTKQDAIASATAVRRLTPVECERLQGFPDGWTATSGRSPQSDSARYRQLGNSVAVPVFEWVMRRIVAHGQVGAAFNGEAVAA